MHLNDLDNWPRCVQVAWQIHDKKGELVSHKSFLINQTDLVFHMNPKKCTVFPLPLQIKQGASLQQVLDEFYDAIVQVEFLVGHNISFDRNILSLNFYV